LALQPENIVVGLQGEEKLLIIRVVVFKVWFVFFLSKLKW